MLLNLEVDTKVEEIVVTLYGSDKTKPQDTCGLAISDYENNIVANSVTLQNSYLPPAVRYLDLSTGIVLFERPPCYVPFNFSNAYQANLRTDGESSQVISLPIPWQRYVLFLAHNGLPIKLFVFFANAPITSLTDDPMSFAPLPNLYEDSSVCLPVFDYTKQESFDLADAISNAYNLVWKSGFNSDILKGYQSWLGHKKNGNPLYKVAEAAGGKLERFYLKWSKYSLEEIVKASWVAPTYLGFTQLIQCQNEYQIDWQERLVDIYLAARD